MTARHLELYTPYFAMLEIKALSAKVQRQGNQKLRFKIMEKFYND